MTRVVEAWRISCLIRVRIRFESLQGPNQFYESVSAPQVASASAHMKSLLRVHIVTICCRIPHAASARRIRTHGVVAEGFCVHTGIEMKSMFGLWAGKGERSGCGG